MPRPKKEWEHLQTTVMQTHNKVVRDYFSDLGGEEWEPEITTSRGSLRTACTVADNDTSTMVLIRMLLFNHTLGYKDADSTGDNAKELTAINRATKPTITLYFLEPKDEVEEGYRRLKGEISFRIMGGINFVDNKNELRALANKIKNEFAKPTRFVWKRGKSMYSYADWDKGYQLQLLGREEGNIKELISKVLAIQNHNPDWEYLNISNNDNPAQAYPTIPETITLLGKTRRKARRRPIASVRYCYSCIKIPGEPERIILHDSTGLKSTALVKD